MRLLDRFRDRCVILLYHRIARVEPDPWGLCVTPEHFAEHLDVLRAWRRVRLDKIGPPSWSIGGRGLSAAITFDDGYADNLYQAAPLLERSDSPATFFLATGYIGRDREFWWDELEKIVFYPVSNPEPAHLSCGGLRIQYNPQVPRPAEYFALYEKLQPLDHDRRRRILDQLLKWSCLEATARESHRCLTRDEVVRLSSERTFEIGAHTVSHPLLAAQPLKSQYEELTASKAQLESLIGRPVTSFSYPYGGRSHYTSDTVRAVADSHFERACSTAPRPVDRKDTPYELPRFNVTDMDGDQFERCLFSFEDRPI
jgi:peptidoglycan/xylan/chitin deacetylase (PgdA/CDA1 family)